MNTITIPAVATKLAHLTPKAICENWWLSESSDLRKKATSIIGSLVVWANGKGNSTRIADYCPTSMRVRTETGSIYQLGAVDVSFLTSHKALMEQMYLCQLEPVGAKRVYPKQGQVYTYEEIQKLYLRDSPSLGFDLNGRKQCLQDSIAYPDEIIEKSPRIAESKWVYVKETYEWIPVFRYADERPITDIIDRHREHGEYVFIFAGFPR